MSEFDRELGGFRYVVTRHGDTLQRIAAREMGDAGRWVDIANINNLLPPYLTDDPALASSRILLTGRAIILPAQSGGGAVSASTAVDEAALYLVDVSLRQGLAEIDADGDIALLSGRPNLKQALKNRILVERGELIFHPEYGCLVRTLIGAVNSQTSATLAAKYVRATLELDPRVKEVTEALATVVGDRITVTATVQPTTGSTANLEVTL